VPEPDCSAGQAACFGHHSFLSRFQSTLHLHILPHYTLLQSPRAIDLAPRPLILFASSDSHVRSARPKPRAKISRKVLYESDRPNALLPLRWTTIGDQAPGEMLPSFSRSREVRDRFQTFEAGAQRPGNSASRQAWTNA
jgi:hypothetical protein